MLDSNKRGLNFSLIVTVTPSVSFRTEVVTIRLGCLPITMPNNRLRVRSARPSEGGSYTEYNREIPKREGYKARD